MPSWLGVLVRRGYLLADPTEDLRLKRPPEQLPKAFSDTDLRRLVEAESAPDPAARSPWPARDRTALEVLAGTRVRASEACALKVSDVVSNADADPVLRVTGKGKRQRTILWLPETRSSGRRA